MCHDCRSLGWRTRYVTALNPFPLELTVDHPLLTLSSARQHDRKKTNASSLDEKPSANALKENVNILQQTIRLMEEGGVLSGDYRNKKQAANSQRGVKGDKIRKEGANSASAMNAIDLISSGDERDDDGGTDMLKYSEKPNASNKRKRDAKAAKGFGKQQIQERNSNMNDKIGEKTTSNRSETCSENRNAQSLSWVEVLCYKDQSKSGDASLNPKSSTARWVPIHPEHESFDEPEAVESFLARLEAQGNSNNDFDSQKGGQRGKMSSKSKWAKSPSRQHTTRMRAKKSPVSYVLAVEHTSPLLVEKADDTTSNFLAKSDSNLNLKRFRGARFTDVTPRYASTWSQTLSLRGATGKDITKGGGKCVDDWWAACLKELNRRCKCQGELNKAKRGNIAKSGKYGSKSKSPTHSVTKSKNNRGQQVDMVEIFGSDDEINKGEILNNESESDEDGHDKEETKELKGAITKEKIPTSKAAFKRSPFYVIPSVLNSQDVLHPDARKRICGVFKGELVYQRSDVSKALREKKWLYEGRKVKESEMKNPVKQIKARKKPEVKGFKALDSYGASEYAQEDLLAAASSTRVNEESEMDNLYGKWQTKPWTPSYVGPNDPIPTNEYKNVELALLNPGLTHIELPHLSKVARKLGVPYAPCMLGFEGHGGNRAPTIRGIVTHDHNVALLREAYVEWESHIVEVEREEKKKEILKKWKRLVVGILTKDRLDREYG